MSKLIVNSFLLFLVLIFSLQVRSQDFTEKPKPSPSPTPAPLFTDRSAATGLNFTHFNGMTGKLDLPEIMGSGSAFFDYDNDGDLDVFLVQGIVLEPGKTPKDAVFPWTGKSKPMGRLYRNDMDSSKGPRSLRFTDVTEKSGIVADGYGFGVSAADVNNDGFADLYLSNLDDNKLFLNDGDGTFTDATGKAGVKVPDWSIGASFFDYDRDGWLDLFVVNYGDYRNSRKQPLCYSKTTARDYCGPKAYRSVKNYLFRNRGNGTFEDVSAPSGISSDTGHSLGVVTADLNADGWTDIYVANDGDPNEVWINKKNGRFENDAFFSGAAVNKHGKSEASMGVDAGDINLDGKLDLFITHLMEETHTLYVNEGDAMFEDITNSTNLGLPDVRLTGFGTLLFDFDNDGLLDVFIANGSVKLLREVFRPGNSGTLNPRYPLGQQNQLFRNVGKGIFEDVSGDAGGSFLEKRVSRGAAFGDVDNDGDTDILVSNNSGPAELLINRGNESGWIGFQLTDKVSGRDLLGTRLEVVLENGRILQRRARTDGSYSSSHDPRVLVGLGRGDKIKTVRVFWPDGSKGVLLDPKLNSYNKISFDAGSSK